MLLHGRKLIQHIVIHFQACSNSAYLQHSGERYRTIGRSSGCFSFGEGYSYRCRSEVTLGKEYIDYVHVQSSGYSIGFLIIIK